MRHKFFSSQVSLYKKSVAVGTCGAFALVLFVNSFPNECRIAAMYQEKNNELINEKEKSKTPVLLFIIIILFLFLGVPSIFILTGFFSNKTQENEQDDKNKDEDEKENEGEKSKKDTEDFNDSGNRNSGVGTVAYVAGGGVIATSGAAVYGVTKLLKRNNLVNAKVKVSQTLGQEIDDTDKSLEKIVENDEQEQLTEKSNVVGGGSFVGSEVVLSPQEVTADEKVIVTDNEDNIEEDTLEVSATSEIVKNNVEKVLVNEESTGKDSTLDDSNETSDSSNNRHEKDLEKNEVANDEVVIVE